LQVAAVVDARAVDLSEDDFGSASSRDDGSQDVQEREAFLRLAIGYLVARFDGILRFGKDKERSYDFFMCLSFERIMHGQTESLRLAEAVPFLLSCSVGKPAPYNVEFLSERWHTIDRTMNGL
jgi:hypothetical protein